MPTCILCICEGATKNCTKESDIQRRQGFYGMFAMQKEYWLDGGKLRLREDDKLSLDAGNLYIFTWNSNKLILKITS